jgi:hypothetical protein
MTHGKRRRRGKWTSVLPLVLLALAAPLPGNAMQEECPAPNEEKDLEEMLGFPKLSEEDAADRMKALFGKVELRLREIDALLNDASAGDTTRLTEVEEAGIGELLRASLKEGRKLQQEIEEIIAITPP